MLYISNKQDSKNIEDFIIVQYEMSTIKLIAKAAEGLFHHLNLTVSNYLILSSIGKNGGEGLRLAKLINNYDNTKKSIFIFARIKKLLIKWKVQKWLIIIL